MTTQQHDLVTVLEAFDALFSKRDYVAGWGRSVAGRIQERAADVRRSVSAV